MSKNEECKRLFRRLKELFDEDNSPYPLGDDGMTVIPRDKWHAWTAALLDMAAFSVLKVGKPNLDQAAIVPSLSRLSTAAIRAMVQEVRQLE